MELKISLLHFLNFFLFVTCPYPPTGDEVVPGSVLLPATRRGRYLANIVRRQAVDGTGIKFNKDADRMNAEAKKKVDVLSHDLLPYIIAEQERRVTLHRKVVAAIQNGDKGVTIAEIRNKPPLIIRKGVLYRCPRNRPPKEPDGSGIIMCEDDIEPTQKIYDSCTSAEDRELFNVADKDYFFCNRHRYEGPDVPRNYSTAYACAPKERTPLNYTKATCALEDTYDVVIHFRYYPDRSFKYVNELDPDHEVCDHWNPCQIGYIFSLAQEEKSTPAHEMWPNNTVEMGDYIRDEIVDAIPEDADEEFVNPNLGNEGYKTSARRLHIPPGYVFSRVWATRTADEHGWNPCPEVARLRRDNYENHGVTCRIVQEEKSVTISLDFDKSASDYIYSNYYGYFKKPVEKSKVKRIKFLTIVPSSAIVQSKTIRTAFSSANETSIPYKCSRCHLQGIMIRTPDEYVLNVDPGTYRLQEGNYHRSSSLTIKLEDIKTPIFGDYFAVVQNADGIEERIKILSVEAPSKDVSNLIRLSPETVSVPEGSKFDKVVSYTCDNCDVKDVICGDRSAKETGSVSLIPASKLITFNFPSFDNNQSCVYKGIFGLKSEDDDTQYVKEVLALENASPEAKIVNYGVEIGPELGEQFEKSIQYQCASLCSVEMVTVNGVQLESSARRSGSNGPRISRGFYTVSTNDITVRITEYASSWDGVYQALIRIGDKEITKNLFKLQPPGQPAPEPAPAEVTQPPKDNTAAGGEGTPANEGEPHDPNASEAGEPHDPNASEAGEPHDPNASEAGESHDPNASEADTTTTNPPDGEARRKKG